MIEWATMNARTNFDAGSRRRLLTVDEVLAMQRTGVFEDDEKFELIEGELILTQSKLNPHNLVRTFYRLLPDDVAPWVEAALYLRPRNAPDPDIMLFPRGRSIETLAPEEVHLVVEVADTTLPTDLGVKATLYARFKVAEYWVIDVGARRLVVHRDPDGEVWRQIQVFGADEAVAPQAFPNAAIRLADLES